MIALGPDRHGQWLAGAHAMDAHFRSAPAASNLPVLLALLAVWNRNFLGAPSQVVAPYAQKLERFVAWLQQLEMESNGKCVHRDGRRSAWRRRRHCGVMSAPTVSMRFSRCCTRVATYTRSTSSCR